MLKKLRLTIIKSLILTTLASITLITDAYAAQEQAVSRVYLQWTKGTDLSVHSQEQLDAIAYELNIRPRQRFEYRCPIEVISDVMAREYNATTSVQ